MKFYAIEINRASAPIIALLNNGVEPATEKKKTFFIFDATWNSDFVPEILTMRDLADRFSIKSGAPLVMSLKED